jgi:hypothetical protein
VGSQDLDDPLAKVWPKGAFDGDAAPVVEMAGTLHVYPLAAHVFLDMPTNGLPVGGLSHTMGLKHPANDCEVSREPKASRLERFVRAHRRVTPLAAGLHHGCAATLHGFYPSSMMRSM